MFYGYIQNNSRGKYTSSTVELWVEADSPAQADQIAQWHHEVYFDGVDLGLDCGCCGDRWRRASEWNAEEYVTSGDRAASRRDWWGGRGLQVKVARRDGRVFAAKI